MVGPFKNGLGVFNGTTRKEALDLIEALALYEDTQPVHIRVAPGFDGATWLDLGRDDGQSVRINPTRCPCPRRFSLVRRARASPPGAGCWCGSPRA